MKIAIVSLSYLPINNTSMGGLEVFVSELAKRLVKKGHEITIFGLKDSSIEGVKVEGLFSAEEIREDALPLDNKFFVRRYVTYQSLACLEVLKRQNEFDIIHINLAEWQLGFLLGNNLSKVVVTAHGNYMTPRLTKEIISRNSGPKLATVSKFVYNTLFPEYDRKFVAYNGIDIEKNQFNSTPQDYLVWLGRISSGKAPHLAIDVAERSGKKLIIAGGIDYQDYFDNEISPRLSDQIEYIGPIFGEEKSKLLGGAQACLFTSQLEESFGLVAAESMACGTPVIAFNKGALGEVIENNITGFVVDSVEGMAEKINNVNEIDRDKCRQRVENNFTLDKMTDRYLEIYSKG